MHFGSSFLLHFRFVPLPPKSPMNKWAQLLQEHSNMCSVTSRQRPALGSLGGPAKEHVIWNGHFRIGPMSAVRALNEISGQTRGGANCDHHSRSHRKAPQGRGPERFLGRQSNRRVLGLELDSRMQRRISNGR